MTYNPYLKALNNQMFLNYDSLTLDKYMIESSTVSLFTVPGYLHVCAEQLASEFSGWEVGNESSLYQCLS